MFRKIVSNLAFSPALVGQLGFYAKRLRKEEATRRLSLVFVALALVVQSLVVFQPPESANAASSNDMVYGGLGTGSNRSLNNFLRPYDANTSNLQDIMNHVGITRAEITAAQFTTLTVGERLSWGHNPRFSAAQGEQAVPIKNAAGATVTTMYARPLKLFEGSSAKIYGWVGYSPKVGWFAIMQACGNLVTDKVPPAPTPPKPVVPTPPKPTSPPANVVLSKTAQNISQGNIDATSTTAKQNDQIRYTITAKNTGGTSKQTDLVEDLSDVAEYATVMDAGGGTYNTIQRSLRWPAIELAPGEQQIRSFVIRIKDTIPATPQGLSDPTSYDCHMMNVFGNNVTIKVDCAPPKVVEQVVTELPQTGPTENLIFSGIILAAVTYFYVRTRLIGKEIKLIRRDLNAGNI